jgi:hypothetical protein
VKDEELDEELDMMASVVRDGVKVEERSSGRGGAIEARRKSE